MLGGNPSLTESVIEGCLPNILYLDLAGTSADKRDKQPHFFFDIEKYEKEMKMRDLGYLSRRGR